MTTTGVMVTLGLDGPLGCIEVITYKGDETGRNDGDGSAENPFLPFFTLMEGEKLMNVVTGCVGVTILVSFIGNVANGILGAYGARTIEGVIVKLDLALVVGVVGGLLVLNEG